MSKRRTRHIIAFRATTSSDRTVVGVINKETNKYYLLPEKDYAMYYCIERVGYQGKGVDLLEAPSNLLGFHPSEVTMVVIG